MKIDLSYFSERAAYDMSGISEMKRQSGKQSPAALRRIATEFESLFIQMMMKSMRQAVPQSDLLNNQNTHFFTSMYDQQIAQQTAGSKGFGLAEMLLKQMMPKAPTGAAQSNAPNEKIDGSKAALGQTLFADNSSQRPPKNERLFLYQEFKPSQTGHILPKNTSLIPGQTKQPPLTDNIVAFVKEWLRPAREAAGKIGIPYEVIIAQAALETGWGQKHIKTDNGAPSHNYFGIKAGSSWTGKTTTITTTEFENNLPSKVTAAFRVYDSHSDAVNDYARLLKNQSRYHNVTRASTPEEAAYALQQANYATDPNYGDKLIQTIRRIKQVHHVIAQQ